MKRLWHAETGFFLFTLLVVLIAGRCQLLSDPGTFWHVAVGQRMLTTGELLRHDPYSFSLQNTHWIAWQWLLACPLALLHRICGLDGLLLATATALACLYAWIARRLMRAGLHWLLTAVFLAFAAAASSYHFHPRPHMVTMVLLAWTFARLCDFESGRISVNQLWAFAPVFVVWANIHGGMIGGVATLALAVAGWTAARFLGQPSPLRTRKQLARVYLLVVLCGLSAFVNPFGAAMPQMWLSVLRSRLVGELMQEHARLIETTAAVPVGLFAALYLLVLLGTLGQRPRVTWVIPLVWLVLAYGRVRHGPLFAVTGVLALAEMFPRSHWAQWLEARGSDLFRRPVDVSVPIPLRLDYRPALLPLGLVLLCVALQVCSVAVPVLGSGWAQLDRRHWPVDLLPELQEREHDRPQGTPIFNEMRYGGFLIYFTPGYRVFIDDRCELYGNQALLDGENALESYARAAQGDPASLEHWSQLYGFDLALVQTDSAFDRYLRAEPHWVSLSRTPTAGLYRRRPSRSHDSHVTVRRERGAGRF